MTFARVKASGGAVSGIMHVSKVQLGTQGARSHPDARRVLSVDDAVEVVVLEAAAEKGSMRVGLVAPQKKAAENLVTEVETTLAAVGKR